MPSSFIESIKIILGTILFAILYGIAHDVVTAHVYVEYFTKFHPHIIDSESPMAMALLWGVIATWWMGLLIGIPIAASAQFGQTPKLAASLTLLKLAKGTAAVYLIAMITLLIALPLCRGRTSFLQPDPGDLSGRFLAVLITHNISYFLSAAVAVGVCIHNVIRRKKLVPPVQKPTLPDA
jgi:hypothetical protein